MNLTEKEIDRNEDRPRTEIKLKHNWTRRKSEMK